jgi:MmpS family membrane protein
MANFGTMGTISPDLRARHRREDDLRDYPDDDTWETEDTDAYPVDDYNWTGWPAELRWRPATAVLGAVVAIGAIATAVIINSGDSASTKATVGAPVPHPVPSAPATTKPSVPPSASPSPSRTPQLAPETVTTVPPTSAVPSLAPTATPTAAPPALAPGQAPAPALNPRTVVYTVTGTKQLLDLVNVVYTDARGYPQTEFNVSLPWSRMVVLNPGVQTESVVATSFYGQLNCSVINAAGQLVVASTANSSLATCTR